MDYLLPLHNFLGNHTYGLKESFEIKKLFWNFNIALSLKTINQYLLAFTCDNIFSTSSIMSGDNEVGIP